MRPVAVVLLLLPGCLAYNEDCPIDESPVVGTTLTPFDLRPQALRTGENAFGNLVADAFLAHAATSAVVDIALVNAGSIRDHDDCQRIGRLDAGPIRLGLLAELLPFDNKVTWVEVSEADLWRVLEHSVAQLGKPGEAGAASSFLQLSHLRMEIDCNGLPATATFDGARVTQLEIDDAAGAPRLLDRGNIANQTYRVAVNTSLSGGGDGFRWLNNPAAVVLRPDFVAVNDLIANAPGKTVSPAIEGRIVEKNCRVLP